MTAKDLWGLVKAAISGWVDDYAQSMGAALAYYTMFSIAPLLLIVISIAGLCSAIKPRAAKSSVSWQGCWALLARLQCKACLKACASQPIASLPQSSAVSCC